MNISVWASLNTGLLRGLSGESNSPACKPHGYLAIASRSYLGNPKVPTVFVYLLDEGGSERVLAYKGQEPIVSPTFPELKLTTEQILDERVSFARSFMRNRTRLKRDFLLGILPSQKV